MTVMTAPYWSDDTVTLHLGKAERVLPQLPDASVDAIVTDPPAAVSFMNREWDSDRGGRDQWVEWLTEVLTEATRCLKPGGHALVWALPRTSHWTALAIEDAGLEIRDCVLHLFGSGFPKSLDVSKAIDKAAGAEREVLGPGQYAARGRRTDNRVYGEATLSSVEVVTAPATEDARRWNGWGTALKPGQEIWWLARKPFRGSVAANVVEHGTGALNIDGTRVGSPEDKRAAGTRTYQRFDPGSPAKAVQDAPHDGLGRWPTNLLLTHSADCAEACVPGCPVRELDQQSGNARSAGIYNKGARGVGAKAGAASIPIDGLTSASYDDQGGASRFFPVFRWQAKAPAHERPKLPDGTAHNTVKPLALMRWLTRLITPPGGLILDPFAGSGTTGEAAVVEGFRALLIEQDPQAAELIRTRLSKPIQPTLGEAS